MPNLESSQEQNQPESNYRQLLSEITALRQLVNQQISSDQSNLENLGIGLQQLAKTLERQGPDYALFLSELKQTVETISQSQEQVAKAMAQNSPSQYLPSIEQKFSKVEDRLSEMEQTIQEQQKTIDAQFDWKVLATNLLTVSAVTTVAVTLAIRLFPPSPDPLLKEKLAVIYQRIEQVRKQIRR
jgi:chromosome segregation ATPase